MFLKRCIPFGKSLGDQEKDRSPKKVKSLIEVLTIKIIASGARTGSQMIIETPVGNLFVAEVELKGLHQIAMSTASLLLANQRPKVTSFARAIAHHL